MKKIGKVLIITFVSSIAISAVAWVVLDSYWKKVAYNYYEQYEDRLQAAWYQWKSPVRFSVQKLDGFFPERPTSLQFGPDQRLYVASQKGDIYRIQIEKTDSGSYRAYHVDTITLIRNIPNHSDFGTQDSSVHDRQVTGLLVTGTAERPVVYVTSSDPRVGGIVGSEPAEGDGDLNLDTNSGMISRLSFNGDHWDKTDLVRGLPRSEENHSINGVALDPEKGILYAAIGGNTNAGSPSKAYGYLSEYALSACILSVDLRALDTLPVKEENGQAFIYDLPTLDDPLRPNLPDGRDSGDPFGGHDGLNQAKLLKDGPVKVHSPGYRNPYDLVLVRRGKNSPHLYTIDNGADRGLGGFPYNEGKPNVTNQYLQGEPGSINSGGTDRTVNNKDNLHLVTAPGKDKPIYGGHPNPVRANPAGSGLLWSDSMMHFDISPTSDWPPVPVELANAEEGDFRNPGIDDGALTLFNSSTNGIDDYQSSRYFKGTLKGDLLAASFNGQIIRLRLNEDGNRVLYREPIASAFGLIPLDLSCQGDYDIFPGTVWIADYGANAIFIMEPPTSADWSTLESSDGSVPEPRHESAFVECGEKFYFLGGRGIRPVNVFDPGSGVWSSAAAIPGDLELNHFQAVGMDSLIYIIGAFTGSFPTEKPLSDIFVFNTLRNEWKILKDQIPAGRLRGSMAASVHEGKIYLCGGNTLGHNGGAVAWTDSYDPVSQTWITLADAPHNRDHFQSVVLNGKLYAIGGRRTNHQENKLFTDTENTVDVYSISTNSWQSLPASSNLPTPRAGAATLQNGNEIWVIGGESSQPDAHKTVEVLDTRTGRWSTRPGLNAGRHGTQAIRFNRSIYIAGGCARQGGNPELNSLEILTLQNP